MSTPSDLVTRVIASVVSKATSTAAPSVEEQYAYDYLARSFGKKLCLPDKARAAERKNLALQKWEASEERCFRTNLHLRNLSDFSALGLRLGAIRDLVADVLGHTVPAKLMQQGGRLSQSATYCSRFGTHPTKKLENVSITSEASLMAPLVCGANDFTVVRGCRMSFVPKTSEVDRIIAIEPTGNQFLQSIVGTFIRSRLKSRAGIDLNDQTRNQDGAFRAVVDDLATIDLESASDSVSTELVRWLLPPDWFSLLNQLRSPFVRIGDDRWRYLEKFSSMGNGFTFELESLIFWAICTSVVESRNVLVYGDDMIVPQGDASKVVALLEACGFVINKDKSFFSGSFYESCGRHYYDLHDVTPVYQKEPIVCPLSAMRCYNRLVRWAQKGPDRFRIVRHALKILLKEQKAFADCRVPFGSERDDGFLTDPRLLQVTISGDFRCTVLKQQIARNHKVNEHFGLLRKLYDATILNEDPRGYALCVRGPTGKPFKRTVTVWASSLTT